MWYKEISLKKRIKDNMRNYSVMDLYSKELLRSYLDALSHTINLQLLLTDSHGIKLIETGACFSEFQADVMNFPGRRLKLWNRTIGYLYIQETGAEQEEGRTEDILENSLKLLGRLGEETYLNREKDMYLDEMQNLSQEIHIKEKSLERQDTLTGLYNKRYFENRMKVIDRSEIVPVAVINANINDWKYVNDKFGDEESDRLISIIANIIQEEAKQDFVTGRIEGDVFGILIPMAAQGEAESYAARIQDRCYTYEDPVLVPSVAVGIVYKTNVEQMIENLLSDAEYEMFNNKLELKNAPDYRKRLEK